MSNPQHHSVIRTAQAVLVVWLLFAGTRHLEAKEQDPQSNQQSQAWTISVLADDERITYGTQRLAEALKAQGHSVTVNGKSDAKPSAGENWVVVGCKDHPGLQGLAQPDDLSRPELGNPEGFLIRSQRVEDALQALAIGANPSGAMYALLQLAEWITLDQVFPEIYVTKPDLELRWYAFYFPTKVATASGLGGMPLMANLGGTIRSAEFFYDKERITQLLDRLAEARFNCLELNCQWINWAAMIYLPDYPEVLEGIMEAEPLTPEKIKTQRIPYLRWLMAQCRRRGIETYISMCMGLTPLQPVSFQTHTDIIPTDENPTPPGMFKYMRDSVHALFENYPDLAGLNLFPLSPVAGTGMAWRGGNYKYFQSVVAGIKDANRKTKPKLILYSPELAGKKVEENEIEAKSAKRILDDAGDVYTPYFSTMPHAEQATGPSVISSFGGSLNNLVNFKPAVAWVAFGDYGSANVTPYLWFSPQYLQTMFSKFHDLGLVGATFYPIRGYYYPDYYERDWLYIKGIGRFAWDSSNDHYDYWVSLLRHHYGCSAEAAQSILKAYTAAADIPTLFTSQFFYSTTMYTPQFGAMLDVWMLYSAREAVPQLRGSGHRISIFSYFDRAEAGTIPPHCIAPPQMAGLLRENAEITKRQIDAASSAITRNREKFEVLRLNMLAWHYSGLHFAEKIEALMDMIQYARKDDSRFYRSGWRHLQTALDNYLKQMEVAEVLFPDTYRDLVLSGDCVTVPHPLDCTVPAQKEELEHYDKYVEMVKQIVEGTAPPGRYPSGNVWYYGYREKGTMYKSWGP